MEVIYGVSALITLEPKPKEGRSTIKEILVEMHENGIDNFTDSKGELNETGMKAQT